MPENLRVQVKKCEDQRENSYDKVNYNGRRRYIPRSLILVI